MPEINESSDKRNASSNQEENVEQQTKEDRQRIFEERFSALMNGFGESCDENNIPLAVAIAIHPEEPEPLVFIRGDEYNTARILAHVLRKMKQEIFVQLDANPNTN